MLDARFAPVHHDALAPVGILPEGAIKPVGVYVTKCASSGRNPADAHYHSVESGILDEMAMGIHKITYSDIFKRANVYNYGCNFKCAWCSYKLKENGKPTEFLSMPLIDYWVNEGG